MNFNLIPCIKDVFNFLCNIPISKLFVVFVSSIISLLIIIMFPKIKNDTLVIVFSIISVTAVILIIKKNILKLIEKHREKQKESKKEYIEILKKIQMFFFLDRWDNFIDNAVRCILYEKFLNADFTHMISTTIWPKKYHKIKKLMLDLNITYRAYTNIFNKYVEYSGDGFCREDLTYKKFHDNKTYDDSVKKHNLWQRQCYYAMNNFVFDLNKLIETLNRLFDKSDLPLVFQSKYAIYDSLGTWSDCNPTRWVPDRKYKIPKK